MFLQQQTNQQIFKQVPLTIGRQLPHDDEDEDAKIQAYRRRLQLQNNKQQTKNGQIFQQNKLNGLQKINSTATQSSKFGMSEINEYATDSKILQKNLNTKTDDQIKLSYKVKNAAAQQKQQANGVKQLKPQDSQSNLKQNIVNLTQEEMNLQNGTNLVKTLQQKYKSLNSENIGNKPSSEVIQGSMSENLKNMQLKQGVVMNNNHSASAYSGGQSNQGSIRYSRKEYLQQFANRNILIPRQNASASSEISYQAPPSIKTDINLGLVSPALQSKENQSSLQTPQILKSQNLKDFSTDLSNVYQTNDFIDNKNTTIISTNTMKFNSQQSRDKISLQGTNYSNALNLLIMDEQRNPSQQNKAHSYGIWSPNLVQKQRSNLPTSIIEEKSLIPQVPMRNHSIDPSASRGSLARLKQPQQHLSQFDSLNRNIIQGQYQSTFQTQQLISQKPMNGNNKLYQINQLQRQNSISNQNNKIVIGKSRQPSKNVR
eukprot:403363359